MAGFNDFIKEVTSDKDLTDKFKSIMEEGSITDKASAIADLAKEHGFSISVEDIMAHVQDLHLGDGLLDETKIKELAGKSGLVSHLTDMAKGLLGKK